MILSNIYDGKIVNYIRKKKYNIISFNIIEEF